MAEETKSVDERKPADTPRRERKRKWDIPDTTGITDPVQKAKIIAEALRKQKNPEAAAAAATAVAKNQAGGLMPQGIPLAPGGGPLMLGGVPLVPNPAIAAAGAAGGLPLTIQQQALAAAQALTAKTIAAGGQVAPATNAQGQPIPEHMKKTRICQNFINGNCTYGDRCLFAHGEHELRPFQPPTVASLEETVWIGIDDPPPTFPVVGKVLGMGGSNMKRIQGTGAKVIFRGKGIAPSAGTPLQPHDTQPPHLYITANDAGVLKAAVDQANALVKELQAECEQVRKNPPPMLPGGLIPGAPMPGMPSAFQPVGGQWPRPPMLGMMPGMPMRPGMPMPYPGMPRPGFPPFGMPPMPGMPYGMPYGAPPYGAPPTSAPPGVAPPPVGAPPPGAPPPGAPGGPPAGPPPGLTAPPLPQQPPPTTQPAPSLAGGPVQTAAGPLASVQPAQPPPTSVPPQPQAPPPMPPPFQMQPPRPPMPSPYGPPGWPAMPGMPPMPPVAMPGFPPPPSMYRPPAPAPAPAPAQPPPHVAAQVNKAKEELVEDFLAGL